MNFSERLQRAIQRGEQQRTQRGKDQQAAELTAEERKSRHSHGRLELSDKIEECLHRLSDHFPGFDFNSLMGENGWGAKISRDDIVLTPGKGGATLYSRLELVVAPMGTAAILEVVAKGAVRNREVFHRRHYQQLAVLDLQTFIEVIEQWCVEYAEQYAAAR